MKKDKWKHNPNDLPRWKRLSPAQPEAPSATPADRHDPASGERLQKILAQAGIASRRAAEEMIASGRVTINGEVVKEMGVRANPVTDTIAVDGKPLKSHGDAGQPQKLVYIAINKPLGVVSTVKDPEGRPTVLSLLAGAKLAEQGLRVYPAGRLDTDSTGLLLLTNDGDLTFRLTHPRYAVEKEYRVVVRGRPTGEALSKLREGVMIEGGITAPAKVDVLSRTEGNTTLRITLHEGRKRQVRLMCAAVGHPVIELTRVRFGPIELGDLQPGKWRNLAVHEAHALRKAVKLKPAPATQLASPSQPSASSPARAPARSRPTRRPQPANAARAETTPRSRPAPTAARQNDNRTRRQVERAPGAPASPPRTGHGKPPSGRDTRRATRPGMGRGSDTRSRSGRGTGSARAETGTKTRTGATSARQSASRSDTRTRTARPSGSFPSGTGGSKPPARPRRTGSAPPRNTNTKRRDR